MTPADEASASAASDAEEKEAPEPKRRVPAYFGRRRKRGNEICQILIRHGAVTAEQVRGALRYQEEQGGQIGQIMVQMGILSRTALAKALLEQLQERRAVAAKNPSLAARESPALAGLSVKCRPLLTTSALLAADWASLSLAALVGIAVNALTFGVVRFDSYLLAMPVIVMCAALFTAQGQYSAMANSPPDEIRNTTMALTFVLVSGIVMGFAVRAHGTHWTPYGAIAWWAAALFLVPIFRAILRAQCAGSSWWGHPVVVIGAGKVGRSTVRTLRAQPSFGLKPVMLLDDDRAKHGTLRARLSGDDIEVKSVTQHTTDLVTPSMRVKTTDLVATDATSKPASTAPRARGMFAEVEGVPVVGGFALASVLAKRLGISYAILALPNQSGEQLVEITERVGGAFSHLLVIPDLAGFASLGVPARDVGGVLGIEVRQQLMLPWPRFAKRLLDVTLTTVGGLVILPFILLLCLAIRLDSPGEVFYFQERVGRDGKRFRAAKFRSMHGDGEERLKAVLDADPKLRAEYEEFHKLTNDPRVTRVGRIVRKYSLDELPQLWNVLRGEMSLIGPRPYLDREIPQMNGKEGIILRAMPGMTGLWQVSDRNATGFAARLRMDVHYVRNWSPWLDIWILARTVGVVLRGTGV
jgi:exopolysaccharide biosynthesis polyprenyl glycosylphosphotransferase